MEHCHTLFELLKLKPNCLATVLDATNRQRRDADSSGQLNAFLRMMDGDQAGCSEPLRSQFLKHGLEARQLS